MLLMIDNYDSFTYNLVQYFGELGQEVSVYRNDEISISEIETLKPKYIVISPGPCTPNEAGISLNLIEKLARKDSNFRGMFRLSGNCSSIWGQHHRRSKNYAWKSFTNSSYW